MYIFPQKSLPTATSNPASFTHHMYTCSRTLECTPHNKAAWSEVVLSRGEWSVMEKSQDRIVLRGKLEMLSTNSSRDLTVTDLRFKTAFISDGATDEIEASTRFLARHDLSSSKEPPRDAVMRK